MSISGLTRRQITSKARKKERKNQPTNQPIKKKRRRIEIPNGISNGKTNAAAYGSHSSIIISYHFVSIIMARFYPFPFDSFFCVCLSVCLSFSSSFPTSFRISRMLRSGFCPDENGQLLWVGNIFSFSVNFSNRFRIEMIPWLQDSPGPYMREIFTSLNRATHFNLTETNRMTVEDTSTFLLYGAKKISIFKPSSKSESKWN